MPEEKENFRHREREKEREEERETRLTEIKRNKRQLMNIRTRQSHSVG